MTLLVNPGNPARARIFNEIEIERAYQDKKWGVEFDNKNTINDWNTYACIYMARATAMGAPPEQQREGIKKTVTLLIAALETFDRNGGKFPPRHYDGGYREHPVVQALGVLGV